MTTTAAPTTTTEPPAADETPNHFDVVLASGDLLQILRAAFLFTDEDEWAPALRAVHLQAGGGVITATATNRHIIGHARKPAAGQLSALISRSDVDLVTRMLADLEETAPVTITQTPSRAAASGAIVTFACTDRAVTVPAVEGTFPDVTGVFATAATAETSSLDGPIALNPELLDAFRKVRDAAGDDFRYDPARLYFAGPASPVRVEIGDWFLGLIVPVADHTSPAGLAGIPNVPFGLPSLSTTPAQTTEGETK